MHLEALSIDWTSLIADMLTPERPRRVRSFRQRDVERVLRAASAAGVNVREITPDGRVILGDPVQQAPEPNGMAKDAAKVVADRLRLVHGSR